nr:hypothetical protein CFP56_38377 [Quercus suber]
MMLSCREGIFSIEDAFKGSYVLSWVQFRVDLDFINRLLFFGTIMLVTDGLMFLRLTNDQSLHDRVS